MGRAASSCLKIMTCGGRGAAGEDAADAPLPEAKSPQDKAMWNFLLRSSRNQVTSNNIAVSGPLASVPEKDEDSEASNKGGSSPQPEQATGKVRMMKFAEFVPKLSFHLTEHESLDSVSEKDGPTDSDPPHQKSKSLEQLPIQNDADDSNDNASKESQASAAPLCDADHCAKESVFVENDSKESDVSVHNSEATSPAHDSAAVDLSLIKESAALKIQTAVRSYLVELALKKHKNVTKLQAAVRGYLVRREAVSTLRCVQAILKMQALVRARRMNHNIGKKEPLESIVLEAERLECLGKEGSACGNSTLRLSNEKLLKNGFIVQLLESTPRSKHIYISCEPSRSDSAWRWLERWMTVISSDSMLQQEPDLGTTHHAPEEMGESLCLKESSEVPAAVNLPEISVPSHPEPIITVKDTIDSSNSLECHAATSTGEQIYEAEEHLIDSNTSDDAIAHNCGKLEVQECGVELELTSERSESEEEDANHTDEEDKIPEVNKYTPEVIESHNAHFDAEQKGSLNVEVAPPLLVSSHAEPPEEKEPSTKAPISHSHWKVESLDKENVDTRLLVSSHVEVLEENEPISITAPISYSHIEARSLDKENADTCEPVTHAASESDSETSVSSSSSESSDSSESESEEVACEKGDAEFQEIHDANNISDDFDKRENENHEEESPSEALLDENLETVNEKPSQSADEHVQSELSIEPALDEQDAHNDNVGLSHPADLFTKSDVSGEPTSLDEQDIHENENNQEVCSLSPERSPSHHIVKANSYETPPNQIPTNGENVNEGDDLANKKQICSEPRSKRSLSEMKNAPSDPKPDQSVADSKTAKRRQSTGTAKLDNGGPRAGSNNSLPSYMQATESARAKVHASVSPKSSPDLKDSNRKKRLSLPAGSEKQNSSPRMQRSGSQVNQNPKTNGVHAPLNFSERRWQR